MYAPPTVVAGTGDETLALIVIVVLLAVILTSQLSTAHRTPRAIRLGRAAAIPLPPLLLAFAAEAVSRVAAALGA